MVNTFSLEQQRVRGRPNEVNLRKFVAAYNESVKPDGCNTLI